MKFITYEAALLLANIAILLILAAASYYSLIKLAQVLRKHTGSKELVHIIQKLVPFSRSIHVYAGVLTGIVAIVHATFFLTFYSDYGIKIYSGIGTILMLLIVASLGLALQRSRSKIQLRHRHRNVAVVFVIALVIHRIIS